MREIIVGEKPGFAALIEALSDIRCEPNRRSLPACSWRVPRSIGTTLAAENSHNSRVFAAESL
jgi:hypothetical protein